MFAYSSVAQIGYITLGVSFASPDGLTAAIVHLFNHGISKAALFLLLGIIAFHAGRTPLSRMRAVWRARCRLTSLGIVLAGLSLIGVPGTAGFVSKWYLVLAALEAGRWWLAALVVVTSLIAVAYVWRFVEAAYLSPPSAQIAGGRGWRRFRCSCRPGCWWRPASGSVSTPRSRSRAHVARPRCCSEPARERRAADRGGGSGAGTRCDRHRVDRAPAESARKRDAGDGRPAVRLRTCAAAAGHGGHASAAVRPRTAARHRTGVSRRAARYAVRADRLGPVDRQFDLLDRLHAGEQGAASDALLRLLCVRARCHHGNRVRRQSAHAVPVLRGAHPRHLSAGHAPWRRAGAKRRAHLPGGAARHVDRFAAAGDRRDLVDCGNAGVPPGRNPAAGAVECDRGPFARAVHVRHRQGRAHAVPPLAACGHGGADPGLGAAARGCGGQGGRVRGGQGDRLRLRRGRACGDGPRRLAAGCRRASRSSPRRWLRCARTT